MHSDRISRILVSMLNNQCNIFFYHLSDKPSDPFNLKVQEIQSNDTKCKLYNKITWEPPHDNGETPLMGYLLEFKHPVITSIVIRTTTHSTEHTICKVQDSSHPREMNVDVRGVNRVGRGMRSNTVKIPFFSKLCFEAI